MSGKLKKVVYMYLFITGLSVHLLALTLLVFNPILFSTIVNKLESKYYDLAYQVESVGSARADLSIEEEIDLVFKPWLPNNKTYPPKKGIWIQGTSYETISEALENIKSGETLELGEGTYNEAFTQVKDNISIIGYGHVIFERAAVNGKAFILNKGNGLVVKNIECRNISVADKNGACIRQEGLDVTLEHVYFNRSENGLLETAKESGNIFIYDSRFELLGRGGQAHGIYTTKANLFIYESLFIASKGEGHEIKSRGAKTEVYNSILASLSSRDSRLIDVSNGGELTVKNSILQQGADTSNGQAIGFALEGSKHLKNTITIEDNIILLERRGHNVLIAKKGKILEYKVKNNAVISKTSMKEFEEDNMVYRTREEAFELNTPYLPLAFCIDKSYCPLQNAQVVNH